MDMKDQPVFRCALDISGAEHGEWQGVLRTDGETREFQSVMELLRLIQSEAGPSLTDWQNKTET
jgi:hypothetical protein